MCSLSLRLRHFMQSAALAYPHRFGAATECPVTCHLSPVTSQSLTGDSSQGDENETTRVCDKCCRGRDPC